MKSECQTLELRFSFGILKARLPDITRVLNEQGREGWQLEQILVPSGNLGGSDRVVVILERPFE